MIGKVPSEDVLLRRVENLKQQLEMRGAEISAMERTLANRIQNAQKGERSVRILQEIRELDQQIQGQERLALQNRGDKQRYASTMRELKRLNSIRDKKRVKYRDLRTKNPDLLDWPKLLSSLEDLQTRQRIDQWLLKSNEVALRRTQQPAEGLKSDNVPLEHMSGACIPCGQAITEADWEWRIGMFVCPNKACGEHLSDGDIIWAET